MIEKYGKSVADIESIKQGFFVDNEMLVQEQNHYALLYNQQPVRNACKMCGETLENGTYYKSHGVEYVICRRCGHVCGTHEETAEYSQYLYADSNYGEYVYSSESALK